ncbi:MAG: phosphotransferase family protein [Candidatus Heimdallarchaeaceae archaeon]
MNADNIESNKHALEVQEELKKLNIIPDNSKLNNYRQLQGGADTAIFEISFKNHSKKYIQRIFRPKVSYEEAEFEYSVQKTLFENGINVPKTYLMKLTPNTRERSYFIMEKIEGTRLDQVFDRNPEQLMQLIEKLLQELHKIHTIDPKLLPQILLPDIQKNPFAIIDQILKRRKSVIERFPKELNELKPVIDWLEDNKTNNPCKKLVVIHGDYHPLNIIVQEDQKFQILDWTGVHISDFRMDLGFPVVAISGLAKMNLAPMIANTYEQISGSKVENLPYFMILANTYNLIRFYSGINNPAITDETEDTMNLFKSFKGYPLFLVDLVKETCNIDLRQIKDYFDV